MRWSALASAAVVAAVLSACATSVPHSQLTPVVASGPDQRLFEGVWRGRVESPDERLAGDIEFRFDREGALILPSRSAPSKILWVRLTGNGVSGALEPYFDPVRKAEVYATFDATLSDGILHGVLRERVGMRWSEAATWSVEHVSN